MKKARISRNTILDNLHKGAVYTCIAVTIYGTLHLGWRYYRYFTEIKPERQRLEMQKLQQNAEENLDKAPELKY